MSIYVANSVKWIGELTILPLRAPPNFSFLLPLGCGCRLVTTLWTAALLFSLPLMNHFLL
jgi:hypothetical protein